MKTGIKWYSVGYAYSSSTWANKFGYGATGCWCVELRSPDFVFPQVVSGHLKKEDAELAMKKLEETK